MIKNAVSKVLTRTDNEVLRAVALSLIALALTLIIVLILIGSLYYYIAFIDGTKIDDIFTQKKSSFSPENPFYFRMVIMAILVAPLLETLLFFKIPLSFLSHYKFNKTLSVHIASFVFALMHVLFLTAGLGKFVTYFLALISSWSWYLYQELPQDKKMLYPYWFLVLIHALYNTFSILIITFFYKFT